MIYILPLFISFFIGLLIIRLLLSKCSSISYLTQIFLSAILGLGISGFIGFSSLWFFNQFSIPYLFILHLLLITTLIFYHLKYKTLSTLLVKNPFDQQDFMIIFLACLITLPIIIYSFLYPFGGWDAWAMWNVKAKFIFLGQEHWQNMFNPILIETNIDYPFLLPLINAWFWSFHGTPDTVAPRIITCLIPFLTAGLLMTTLRLVNKTYFYILSALWIFFNTATIYSSISQYSDQLLGLYLLSFFICFLFFHRTKQNYWLILSSIFIGFLTFSKNEGLVLSLIVTFLACLKILTNAISFQEKKKYLFLFLIFVLLASTPWILFKCFWSPDQHRFINGLLSLEAPSTLSRFLTILSTLKQELLHSKWVGFWIISTIIIFMNLKTAFRREIIIIPLTISLYLFVIIGVYQINTFFEIVWWLETSLNRILFVLVPSLTFWAFSSISD